MSDQDGGRGGREGGFLCADEIWSSGAQKKKERKEKTFWGVFFFKQLLNKSLIIVSNKKDAAESWLVDTAGEKHRKQSQQYSHLSTIPGESQPESTQVLFVAPSTGRTKSDPVYQDKSQRHVNIGLFLFVSVVVSEQLHLVDSLLSYFRTDKVLAEEKT